MGRITVSRIGETTVYKMPDQNAATILELFETIQSDMANQRSWETHRAMINTGIRVSTQTLATQILNDYAILGRLKDQGNYKIAVLIHGDPEVVFKDAGQNWQKGGTAHRALAFLEGLFVVGDLYTAIKEGAQNPILQDDNIEVIYGVQKAQEWLNQE